MPRGATTTTVVQPQQPQAFLKLRGWNIPCGLTRRHSEWTGTLQIRHSINRSNWRNTSDTKTVAKDDSRTFTTDYILSLPATMTPPIELTFTTKKIYSGDDVAGPLTITQAGNTEQYTFKQKNDQGISIIDASDASIGSLLKDLKTSHNTLIEEINRLPVIQSGGARLCQARCADGHKCRNPKGSCPHHRRKRARPKSRKR